ncbi:MAG: cation:proton antiporter, partial [Pseudomonadota bacterium]
VSFKRLWSMKGDIFGLGLAQMIVTGSIFAGALRFFGFSIEAAVLGGFALAVYSTAFALQLLGERGETGTAYGRKAFAVLLFQDLAVIPLIAAVSFLDPTAGLEGAGWRGAATAAAAITALVVIGKYALDPLFRIVAASGSREAFAAAALFVVAAVSLGVSAAGLSMALGAFLAGVLLAESSFKHQIETDIEPFRGILLGLFFIGVGMHLNVPLVIERWPLVLGGALALVAMKTVIITALARLFGSGSSDALRVGATISQGGEFAFVVLSLGAQATIFTSDQTSIISAIVTVSMATTPLLVMVAARLARQAPSTEGMEKPENERGQAIVVGHGRMGQIVSQILRNSGVETVAIELDPDRVRISGQFGSRIFYGDGTRLDLLLNAGLMDSRLIVFCLDDAEGVTRAVESVMERAPGISVIARAEDRLHAIELRKLGCDVIVRETFESAVVIGREGLKALGYKDGMIDAIVEEFRGRDAQRLLMQQGGDVSSGMDLLHRPFDAATPEKETPAEKTAA